MHDVLLTLHILTAIVVLGWLATQSMLLPRVIRQGPENLPVLRFAHGAGQKLGRLSPLVFVFGVLLAMDIGGEIWKQTWLNISMLLFIVAVVIGGVLITKAESEAVRRFEAGQPALDVAKRIGMLGGINALILTVIVYLMVARPA